MVLRFLERVSGYSRQQLTRLVKRCAERTPLLKRYRAIGTRRAPAPNNRPGYLQVDSVHQGDQDGLKGIYHINAVDCVTQYEAVATCERISEAFLIPVLEEQLHSFPERSRWFSANP